MGSIIYSIDCISILLTNSLYGVKTFSTFTYTKVPTSLLRNKKFLPWQNVSKHAILTKMRKPIVVTIPLFI